MFPDNITGKQERHIVLNYRTPPNASGLITIPDYHRMYDPVQCPLLFVKGQDGWHCDMEHTCLQHVNFMLMVGGIMNESLNSYYVHLAFFASGSEQPFPGQAAKNISSPNIDAV